MTAIDYIELPAADVALTKAFYTTVFGWEWIDYGPTYCGTTINGIEIALNGQGTVGAPHAPRSENAIGPLVLFQTVDIVAIEAAVRGAGGDIVSPVYPYPGGQRLHFADPSGNILGIYQAAAHE